MGGSSHVNQSELRRMRHEREQAVMAELGIDEKVSSPEPRQSSSSLSQKQLRAQRSLREQKAASDLGVSMPETPDHEETTSFTRTTTGSIRRARLRREADAHLQLEKERRQKEKEEAEVERQRDLARKRTRREHLKRVRDLESIRPPFWRRLLGSCSRRPPSAAAGPIFEQEPAGSPVGSPVGSPKDGTPVQAL